MLMSCKREKTAQENPSNDTIATESAPTDSTLWGHLGEDTGMSALQFITDTGDTLDLYRTSPVTGEDGNLIGEIRNYTDHFALTLAPDGESMLTAINATQLEEIWKATDTQSYDDWKIWNGHILFCSEQQLEYGLITRVDTMYIVTLNDDSLVIRSHINQILTFKKTKRIDGN